MSRKVLVDQAGLHVSSDTEGLEEEKAMHRVELSLNGVRQCLVRGGRGIDEMNSIAYSGPWYASEAAQMVCSVWRSEAD